MRSRKAEPGIALGTGPPLTVTSHSGNSHAERLGCPASSTELHLQLSFGAGGRCLASVTPGLNSRRRAGASALRSRSAASPSASSSVSGIVRPAAAHLATAGTTSSIAATNVSLHGSPDSSTMATSAAAFPSTAMRLQKAMVRLPSGNARATKANGALASETYGDDASSTDEGDEEEDDDDESANAHA